MDIDFAVTMTGKFGVMIYWSRSDMEKLVSISYSVTLDLRDLQCNGSSMSFVHFTVTGKCFLLAFPGKQNIYIPRRLGFSYLLSSYFSYPQKMVFQELRTRYFGM